MKKMQQFPEKKMQQFSKKGASYTVEPVSLN